MNISTSLGRSQGTNGTMSRNLRPVETGGNPNALVIVGGVACPLPCRGVLSLTDEHQAWNGNSVITKDYWGRDPRRADFTFRMKAFWRSLGFYFFAQRLPFSPQSSTPDSKDPCLWNAGLSRGCLHTPPERRHLFTRDRSAPGLWAPEV